MKTNDTTTSVQCVAHSSDSTKIVYWKSGTGPALILVHGTAADHTRWKPVLSELGAKFTVYAVDRRGSGSSTHEAQPYAVAREFEDIAAVVDAVYTDTGEAPSLLGHSHGAICSLEASLLTPHLKKLILYEPPIPAGPQNSSSEVVSRLEKLLQEGNREEVVSTFMREIVRLPEGQLRLLQSLPAWKGRVAAAHTIVREIKEPSKQYSFRPEKFHSMGVPTLLLLGDASPAYFKTVTDLVHKALPASQVAVLTGQQHAAMDTGKEIFLQPVLEFLAP
ncbi:MAG: alpha/beta hydrolase [Verrucomicrobia bacterium]|nr:alpha/beta hydrolase [Verrucomicrobiota bacterium]